MGSGTGATNGVSKKPWSMPPMSPKPTMKPELLIAVAPLRVVKGFGPTMSPLRS